MKIHHENDENRNGNLVLLAEKLINEKDLEIIKFIPRNNNKILKSNTVQ